MKNEKSHFWLNLLYIYLFFAYFSCGLQLVIFASKHSVIAGLRDAVIYSLFWLIPILLFPKQSKIITIILGLILWATSLIPIGYYSIYQQEFSQSVFFVMSESNWNETHEFLQQYFSLEILFIFFIYSCGAFFLWTRIKPIKASRSKRFSLLLLILFITIMIPIFNVTLIKHKELKSTWSYLKSKMNTTVPWLLITCYYDYKNQLENMQTLLDHYETMPPVANLIDENKEMPRTLVMVIGESTTRTRMSLYGYQRNTTPLLDELFSHNDQLIRFNDVITSRPYTIEILQQVLTFADQRHPDMFLSHPSLIQIMKQAGYKTYWITNQQTMTKRNTILTMFSQQTDEQFYLNNDRNQNARQYDDVIFAPFKQILNEQADKKFIIIHLLGTHMIYRYRFPEEYNIFTDQSNINIPLDSDKLEVYNNYDNAIRYNDFIVSNLIKLFSQSASNGFLLYFSDHGEEVYESTTHNILGRNEKGPTIPMYTVPFILWVSPQWRQNHQIDYQKYVNRKYCTVDLIHTWSDMAGLSYDLYDPTKSIINPLFKEKPRLIGDPLEKNQLRDFDQIFKQQTVKQ